MTLAVSALSCAKQLSRVDAAGTSITDLETEIKVEIGETIRFYNRQKFALTEFRGVELTTVLGQAWYSSVDMTNGDGDQANTRSALDVKDITAITYMRDNSSDGIYDRMERVSYPDFERLFEGYTPNSDPSYFTMYAGQIGLWPTPDAAYTIYFSAHVKPQVPTDDSDTSVWLDEAKELIEAGACRRVCLKYLRDQSRAMEFASIEKSALDALQWEHVSKSSSGKLKVRE